jgi:hypothetical protein
VTRQDDDTAPYKWDNLDMKNGEEVNQSDRGSVTSEAVKIISAAIVGALVIAFTPAVRDRVADMTNTRPHFLEDGTTLTKLDDSVAGQSTSPRMITVHGRGPLQRGADDIYVVVKVDLPHGGYYPIGKPLLASKGSWYCEVALGSPLEVEAGSYRVMLVSVTPHDQPAIVNYLRKRARTDNVGIGESYTKDMNIIGKSLVVNRPHSTSVRTNSTGKRVSDNLRQNVTECTNPYGTLEQRPPG